MNLKLLDTVALQADLVGLDLKAGDVGTVVEVLNAESVEVEFVNEVGETVALVTLNPSSLRRPTKPELSRWPAGKPARIR